MLCASKTKEVSVEEKKKKEENIYLFIFSEISATWLAWFKTS